MTTYPIKHSPTPSPTVARHEFRRRDLDPVLQVIDILCATRDWVVRLARGGECPICLERTRDLSAHHYIDHVGD